MTLTPRHKDQPAPGHSGRTAGRPRMLAARRAGPRAAIRTGRAGGRVIIFACTLPDLWPGYRGGDYGCLKAGP